MLGKRQLVTLSALILAALSALLLIAARPAQAQTETVLYNFGAQAGDGEYPLYCLTSDGKGNFYGVTPVGGAYEKGTVFEMSPNGSGGWKETVLYSFTGGADGGTPSYTSVTFDSLGNLYGTAVRGGAYGYGVVFELSPTGTSWTETVLYSFAGGTDGANPQNGLIMDAAGNIYGTTGLFYGGGASATVFELSPSGGGWTKQVLYNFDSNNYAGLTMDAAGNIFGATLSTVFELSPNGNGGWNPTVIHTFTRGKGANAQGTPVLDSAGNLYGTTYSGGAKGCGTVYRLRRGKKRWTEKTLYSFKGGNSDGKGPGAAIVFDAAGNIYSTTVFGGSSNSGTVFELVAPVGIGSYTEKLLWSFSNNGTDGYRPFGSLIPDSAGNLYGMTEEGGSGGDGVVFEVTP